MTTRVLNPKVTLSIIPGQTLSSIAERSMLIVGQKLSGGSAVSGELQRDVNFLTLAEIANLYGRKSHVAGMIRMALKNLAGINPQPQIDVISLDDASAGSAATSSITLAGTATENGSIVFSIGSKQNHSYTVAVSSGDTAAMIATRLLALVSADTEAPFDAATSGGVLTITCIHDGTLANTWGVGFEGTVEGVTTTLSEWSGGGGNPSLTTVFDAIDNLRETTIIWPEAYPLDHVASFLDTRFNVANDILDGVAISVHADTLTNLRSSVMPLNSMSVNVLGNSFNNVGGYRNKRGPGVFEFSDNIAVEVGIIRALRLTQDAPITNFVSSSGAPSDAFGGKHISSKPYHNTTLPNISIPEPGEYFSQSEQEELVRSGVSVFGANRANNSVVLGDYGYYLLDRYGG